MDHLLFWNVRDLEKKPGQLKSYYNNSRAHSSLDRKTPDEKTSQSTSNVISLDNYRWKSFVKDLFQPQRRELNPDKKRCFQLIK